MKGKEKQIDLEGKAAKGCKIAAVILAAGSASRMGRDKMLLPFKGQPLILHVLRAVIASHLSECSIVIPPEREELHALFSEFACRIVENPLRDTGQASSLQAGLRTLADDVAGAMVLLGDQPLVSPASLNALVSAFEADPSQWVAPTCDGRRGNPVIIPSGWFKEVYSLKGDTGARPLFDHPEIPLKLVELDDPGLYLDVDTEEEYRKLGENNCS